MAALVGFLVAAGAGLQHGLGTRAASAGAGGPSESGAWFCPHGGARGWHVWMVMANPGRTPVHVRITTFGPHGVKAQSTGTVPPSAEVYRPVPGSIAGEGTEIEYFGGWVGAAWVVRGPRSNGFLSGSRCAATPSATWYLPDLPTARGDTSYIVLTNPFHAEAAVSVVLRSDRGRIVRAQPLTPLVVPPRTSRQIKVNQFLLQAPDERTVTADLEVQLGRVVAGGVDLSPGGAAAEVAEGAASCGWSLPLAGSSGGSILGLLDAQNGRSDLNLIGQTATGQQTLSSGEGLSLAPGTPGTFTVPNRTAAGITVACRNGRPISVQRRASGDHGDPAIIDGVERPASRWLLLPTCSPSGGSEQVVIQNPGHEAAEVELRGLGPSAASGFPTTSMVVAPGTAQVVELTKMVGTRPVSVLVTARVGTVVVGGASIGSGGEGFAATVAIPVGT
ncbi:MAG TPA: DUF5719 family protein [Actinomycetota bacterium]